MRLKKRTIFSVLFLILFIYIFSYAVNSFFGGYYLFPEIDGKDRYSKKYGGLGIPLAIQWHPRFGFHTMHRKTFFGSMYYPLIVVDREIWHRTRYVDETDIFLWSEDLKKRNLVHPETLLEESRRKNSN